MTVEMFDNAVNGINAEIIEECAYIDIKPRHRLAAKMKYASIAAAFVLCVCTGIFAATRLLDNHISSPNALDSCENPIECNSYGANISDLDISCDGGLTITGTGFTDEEIYSLVENNKEIIAANVSGEYDCFGSEIQIYTKGYCHAVLGEKNYVHLDYLTLPVCVDNRIAANLEVFKANGELLYTLNAGGDKWDIINEALEYDDEIAFVFFVGYTSEAAVAPDNTIFEITCDSEGTLTAEYDLIAAEYNTFSRSVLYDSNSYITIVSENNYDITSPVAEETTIRENTQTEEISETPIDSDDSVHDDNNETVTYDPISPNASGDSDGNVLLIAALMSQMGNTPLRVSKDESALLIQMLNEIEMEPVDYPDPMNIPFGGGYIMEIEGEEKYELLGGGYIKIGDSYYYDNNGKSDELSAKIGNVLYGCYGEP